MEFPVSWGDSHPQLSPWNQVLRCPAVLEKMVSTLLFKTISLWMRELWILGWNRAEIWIPGSALRVLQLNIKISQSLWAALKFVWSSFLNSSLGHCFRQYDRPDGLATAALMFLAGAEIWANLQTECIFIWRPNCVRAHTGAPCQRYLREAQSLGSSSTKSQLWSRSLQFWICVEFMCPYAAPGI